MDIFNRLESVNFVPVIAAIFFQALKDERFVIDGKRGAFVTEDAIFRFDKCLVNPFHSMVALKTIRCKFREDMIVFSDSGGLQELTQGKITQTPEDVILWQEKNAHIGFSFDSIPFQFQTGGDGKIGDKLFFDSKNFITHAEKSANNLRRANKVRTNPDFKLYGIVQGRTYEEYKTWVDILSSEKTEGTCLKSANVLPISVAEAGIFAYYNLHTPIHFLGVENFSRSVVCIYLSKYYKYPISFDGSSWSMGCRLRTYKLPMAVSHSVQIKSSSREEDPSEDGEEVESANLTHFDFCSCPACKYTTSVANMKDEPIFGVLLSLHNLWHTVSRVKLLKEVISNRKLLDAIVRTSVSSSTAKKIINAFDFIDYAVENGYQIAREKYTFAFNDNPEFLKQTSVFDF